MISNALNLILFLSAILSASAQFLISAECQQLLAQLRHYDMLSAVLSEDIDAQQALVPVLEAHVRACRHHEPSHSNTAVENDQDDTHNHEPNFSSGESATMTDEICLAWKTAHSNHQYRLGFSTRQRDNLLRGRRRIEKARYQLCSPQDEEVLGWRKVLRKHDRAMAGLKGAVAGATDWFGVWREEKKAADGDPSRMSWRDGVWNGFEKAWTWFRVGWQKLTMQREKERRRECPRCVGNPAFER